MSLQRNIASGLRSLFRKERVERELDEELRGFLEMVAEEKMKQGMSRKEALRAVRWKETQNPIIGLICPFLPPRVFVKCPSIRKMDGRGGGNRKQRRRKGGRIRGNAKSLKAMGMQENCYCYLKAPTFFPFTEVPTTCNFHPRLLRS
jgi:hypothetical protein